jgi:hypothetical protein
MTARAKPFVLKPPPVSETDIQKEIKEALARMPGVKIYRNNSGQAKLKGFYVRFGLQDEQHRTGSSDFIGRVRMKFSWGFIARFFAIEVKKPGEKPDEDQIKFINDTNREGGFAVVCRSWKEAVAAVKLAQAGEQAPLIETPEPAQKKVKKQPVARRGQNEIKS